MVPALKRDTLGIDLLHSIAGEVEETLTVTQDTHSLVLAPSPCLFFLIAHPAETPGNHSQSGSRAPQVWGWWGGEEIASTTGLRLGEREGVPVGS